MKVLLCHNYYQQRGGEDESFEAEADLLRRFGHRVVTYTLHNDAIHGMTPLRVAGRTVWSRTAHRELSELLRRDRPDVMHCTNTFPLISPAAYHAAHRAGVAVVQSLHNFRLACVHGQFVRDGRVCEDCLGKPLAWPGIVHGCYRGSRAGSAAVAAMNFTHRVLGTWARRVDRYCVLTDFTRRKAIASGLPAERLAIKPNFLAPDPGPGQGRGGYAVFVGRLSPEKGVRTLVEAWRGVGSALPLKIVGEGPLDDLARDAAATNPAVTWLGKRPLAEVVRLLGDATCVVMSSVSYETFGRTIMEGFARGTPAVVPNHGAMAELVDDGRTGLHFTVGDPHDLAAKVLDLVSQPERLAAMRDAARRTYLERYTAERNYELLVEIYQQAIDHRRQDPRHAAAPTSPGGSDATRPPIPPTSVI